MNAAIQTTRKERTVVEEKRAAMIMSVDHAIDILNDFRSTHFSRFAQQQGAKNSSEAYAIVYAAACKVVSGVAPMAQPALADLGIAQLPDAPAEPTWTSQNGESVRVRELPTRHLVNIVNKYGGSRFGAAGIIEACRDELQRRPREAA
jgi:hypothetical protein